MRHKALYAKMQPKAEEVAKPSERETLMAEQRSLNRNEQSVPASSESCVPNESGPVGIWSLSEQEVAQNEQFPSKLIPECEDTKHIKDKAIEAASTQPTRRNTVDQSATDKTLATLPVIGIANGTATRSFTSALCDALEKLLKE